MFAITISEKGGETTRLSFDKPEITIGRVQGNDIVLPKGNVSKRHSRIVLKEGKYIVVDLKSTNGTYVNGRKITSPIVIRSTDKVYIGDFVISIDDPASVEAQPELPPPPPAPRRPTGNAPPPPLPRRTGPSQPTAGSHGEAGPPAPAMHDDELPPPDDYDEPHATSDERGGQKDEPRAYEPSPQARVEILRSTRPLDAAGSPAQSAAPASSARPGQQPRRQTVMGEPGAPARVARPQPAIPTAAPASQPPERVVSAPPPEVAAPPPASPRESVRSQPAMPLARFEAPAASPPLAHEPPRGSGSQSPAPANRPTAPRAVEGDRTATADAVLAIAQRLSEALGADSLTAEQLEDPLLWQRAERIAAQAAAELGGALPPGMVAHDAVAEVLGNGPLDELLADASIDEIRVPRHDRILVERDGERVLSDRFFSSSEALARVVTRLAGDHEPDGGLIDLRLPDGYQLVAALPPLAVQAALTIRRPRRTVTLAQLVEAGALSQRMADLLSMAVRGRRSVLVTGELAADRGALMSALQHEFDGGDAVVVVGHSGGGEGATEIHASGAGGAQRALGAALRLEPDRLMIGGEATSAAVEALAALPGTIVSIAASSGVDAVSRLLAQARLSGGGLDAEAVRDGLATQLHLVATVTRGADGQLHVSQIAEMERIDGRGRASLADIFLQRTDGTFAATGHVPAFAEGAAAALFKS